MNSRTNDPIINEKEFHNLKYSRNEKNDYCKIDLMNNLFYKNNYSSYNYFFNLIQSKIKNKDVLECGCGLDGYSKKFGNLSGRYVAFDISEEAIKYQKNFDCSQKNVEYYTMNIENMNFGTESFDIIFGKSILHHTNLENTFYEIFRVLKPNGQAFFLEPIIYNPIVFIFRKLTPTLRMIITLRIEQFDR
jgi:ubiquinone/menaquinone biosynthesis C-methylase UbiE